ncbi:MAG: helix-turn-helix domain-containing protein [Candidatus Pedobacter colombiensis]|uniref:Helix-turn-helix domain-containing protein n=1 Tax=Candidatus Pedobacter colombiensis TaxID=3121371 RepID=A0AAJ5W706_9SPHI|nr:helix-turn-helix domain-containing protein [Pedobacter sp.]WEK18280.1 MAG: helix-turn-helix domain-containing protein [Pedobacter sp.]
MNLISCPIFGEYYIQWIDHITILHAKTLLKSSNLSIKEISNELHFEESSVFCRYFKRIAGVSPKTYRNE